MLARLGHLGVNGLEGIFNVIVGFQKALGTFGLDSLESLCCLGGILLGLFVVRLAVFQTLSCRRESFVGLNITSKKRK